MMVDKWYRWRHCEPALVVRMINNRVAAVRMLHGGMKCVLIADLHPFGWTA